MKSDIAALYQQLKIAKASKGEVASKFKFTDKQSSEYPTLLASMQEISAKIKALETEIKIQEKSAASQETNATPEKSPFSVIDSNSHWPEPFNLRTLSAPEFARWDGFLQQHAASAYHQSIWFRLIKKTFGHDTQILVAEDNNQTILGGVPLTFFSSKIFGKFAVSIPFVNYGGAISNYFNIATALLQRAQTVCLEQNLSHIEIRTMQQGLAGNSLDKKVSMVLELPESNADLEKNLGAKVRAQYKKAEAHSPSVKVGRQELLNDFYQVFARNMRDLGTPVYSKQWFANILDADAIKATILLVYMGGKPVSAGFLVGSAGTLEIPWASTISSANAKNANMWMYRQILAYAIAEGYRYFDFGRSTMGAGTYKFKKQWGAQAYSHHWYYLMPSGSKKPELNPDNPKFKLFIFLWKLMPVWLSKMIGPQIIKHIP